MRSFDEPEAEAVGTCAMCGRGVSPATVTDLEAAHLTCRRSTCAEGLARNALLMKRGYRNVVRWRSEGRVVPLLTIVLGLVGIVAAWTVRGETSTGVLLIGGGSMYLVASGIYQYLRWRSITKD